MPTTTLTAAIEAPLDPPAAFTALTADLVAALARLGIRFDPAPDGRVAESAVEVGRVVAWEPPGLVALEWRAADWQPEESTRVELRCEPIEGGTRVTIEQCGWGGLLGGGEELVGWFAGEVAAPLLRATAPGGIGDWLTDRGARRPSGRGARATYRDPVYHVPFFRVILDELAPGPDDVLLDVGCGGGAFLARAMAGGCRAAGADHSPEMVRVAREANRAMIEEGRLEVREASADRLPFPEETFTCAAMTGVLGFLPDPVAALAEVRRVLRPGGRLAVLGSDPEARGTMAAPEPFASRLRFYDDEELVRLGREAGFDGVRVERRSVERQAREAGVPEEHLPLFAGPGPRFLFARKG